MQELEQYPTATPGANFTHFRRSITEPMLVNSQDNSTHNNGEIPVKYFILNSDKNIPFEIDKSQINNGFELEIINTYRKESVDSTYEKSTIETDIFHNHEYKKTIKSKQFWCLIFSMILNQILCNFIFINFKVIGEVVYSDSFLSIYGCLFAVFNMASRLVAGAMVDEHGIARMIKTSTVLVTISTAIMAAGWSNKTLFIIACITNFTCFGFLLITNSLSCAKLYGVDVGKRLQQIMISTLVVSSLIISLIEVTLLKWYGLGQTLWIMVCGQVLQFYLVNN